MDFLRSKVLLHFVGGFCFISLIYAYLFFFLSSLPLLATKKVQQAARIEQTPATIFNQARRKSKRWNVGASAESTKAQ
jgi:hypothetical protein